jgi:hypothetical protein
MKKILILIIICLSFANNLSASDIVIPALKNCDYISIFHGPWIFEFAEDGSINAQYGSGPFDNGRVPEGSVDFELLYNEIKKILIQKKVNCSTQAVFHKREDVSSTALYLKENLYIRNIIEKNDSRWTSFNIERFNELKNKYPFFNE